MKNLATVLLVAISFTAISQVPEKFPATKTESLTHKFIDIPKDINGRYSLLCMASTKEAETHMQTWFNPIYNHFLTKPDPNSLFGFSYDIDVYFIPMFTGAKRVAYKKQMAKAEKSVAPEMKPYVLFYEGTLKEYRDKLGMEDKKEPYFYILDKESKIIHTTSGRYTKAKMQEIINLVEPAMIK
ncbi:hypothetical protein [Reichenbachiella versicolor]|uniref:hypothetical protein n=1 Tax=Reichenbachiella versicolor TaxID=1821036 RepID=UPI000D6E7B66|nr:hypothetical protein [Reichenbachiella versicolor]